ncbi:MAG: MBOAT family protein, partial [Muribaculaceae bacterium]|nr:MBOAT family protein [Muribaculaceae bacterium]
MTFVSAVFLVFLTIVFLLHWFVFKPVKWRNIFIIIASLVFYAWADWRLLALILFTTASSYASGIMIERAETRRKKKAIAATSVTVNLAILATFKYLNFFIEGIAQLLAAIGFNVNVSSLNIILPIGISFYTLQAVGYTLDVLKGAVRATHNAPAFFAYITFFPQLVAGPIERAERLVPQFAAQRKFDYNLAVDGLRQMLWGFAKKMVVADTCAKAVDTIWTNPTQHGGATLVIGAILFTIQIYADFSGYSDIAIGTAKLFGIRLTKNFNVPFFARNVAEFWRRWHISLMQWFTRYVYIPLGGSRCSTAKHMRNIAIVFLISGLWHGANITYVAWGVFHAIALIVCVAMGNNTRYENVVAHDRRLPRLRELVQMLATF